MRQHQQRRQTLCSPNYRKWRHYQREADIHHLIRHRVMFKLFYSHCSWEYYPCLLQTYIVLTFVSSSDRAIKKPQSSHATSDSTKDIVIIVLAVVVGLLISACIIHTVCRIRNQKTKSDDKVPSYEEVKRNNDTKENEYATIQN